MLSVVCVVCFGEVRRASTTISCGTNSAQVVTGTIYEHGLLYRTAITVTGGSLTINVTDKDDGTVLASLTGFTGSTNITPSSAIAFVGATVTTTNASATNMTATVALTVQR